MRITKYVVLEDNDTLVVISQHPMESGYATLGRAYRVVCDSTLSKETLELVSIDEPVSITDERLQEVKEKISKQV